MAEDYGVDDVTMRKILLHSIFNNTGALASMAQAEAQARPAQGATANVA
jgi:hypothetical protein